LADELIALQSRVGAFTETEDRKWLTAVGLVSTAVTPGHNDFCSRVIEQEGEQNVDQYLTDIDCFGS
jgi:hypothetical protein